MKGLRTYGIAFLLAGLGIGIIIGSSCTFSESKAGAETQKDEAAKLDSTPQARLFPLGRTPSAIKDNQYPRSYFPNTELLGPDEMRVTALGTGMPNLTRKQKSACFMVELGNGDVFLFDIGTGSTDNLSALRPDWSKIDKVFAGHLHTDHVGDFDSLLIGGWLGGRYTPLHLYGPSGAEPELGTKAFAENIAKSYAWDIRGRSGALPTAGGLIEVHEFDYKGINQIVYQKDGVTIRSWPAIHALDGPVSYSLEWKGLKFVFGSDTAPNQWFIKYAKGADMAIHECVFTPEDMARVYRWSMGQATWVSTIIHTPPEAFGKIMAEVKPRLAVAYHTWLHFDLRPNTEKGIRKTYDGPLSMAEDLMVWNITKDHIEVRMAIVDENAWPTGASEAYRKAPRKEKAEISEFIKNGRWKGYIPPPIPED